MAQSARWSVARVLAAAGPRAGWSDTILGRPDPPGQPEVPSRTSLGWVSSSHTRVRRCYETAHSPATAAVHGRRDHPPMTGPDPPRPPLPPTRPTEPLTPRAVPRQPVVAVPVEPLVERLPPDLSPEGPWWANPWPAILTGVVCLIAGGLIGYALGNKKETVVASERGSAGITHTVTHVATVVHPKVVVHTDTVTASTVTQTPSPANAESETRRREAEAEVRKLERENEQLTRQQEEG